MSDVKTRYITVADLEKRLSVSKNQAYRLANSGSFETLKIGSSLRINEESLTRWLESLRNSKARGGSDMD